MTENHRCACRGVCRRQKYTECPFVDPFDVYLGNIEKYGCKDCEFLPDDVKKELEQLERKKDQETREKYPPNLGSCGDQIDVIKSGKMDKGKLYIENTG